MQIRNYLAGAGALLLLLSSPVSAASAAEGQSVFSSAQGTGLYVTDITTVNDLTLKITFSEALTSDPVTLKLTQDSDKTEVAVTKVVLDTTKKIASATLTTPLFISEKYTLYITAAKSAGGKTLSQTTIGQAFTTPDDLAFGDEETGSSAAVSSTPTKTSDVTISSGSVTSGNVTTSPADVGADTSAPDLNAA